MAEGDKQVETSAQIASSRPDANAVLALLQRETISDEEAREMLGLPREKPTSAPAAKQAEAQAGGESS